MEWSGGEWDNCKSIMNKYIKKKQQDPNMFTLGTSNYFSDFRVVCQGSYVYSRKHRLKSGKARLFVGFTNS